MKVRSVKTYAGYLKAPLSVSLALFAAALYAKQLPRAFMPDIFPKGAKILFQGDSITHGGRGRDMNHYLGHGYQAEIAMRYLGYRPDLGLVFCNRGISGNTSADLVARWKTEAIPVTANAKGEACVYGWKKGGKTFVPDILSIYVGVNDFRTGRVKRRLPAERYEANLRKLVDMALAANPKMKIVICQPFLLPEDKSGRFRAYQDAAEKVARDYALAFVPFQRLFSDILMKENPNPLWWTWDEVHPTYAAHMRMADFWLERCRRTARP